MIFLIIIYEYFRFQGRIDIMNMKGVREKRLQYTKVLALGFSLVLSRGYLVLGNVWTKYEIQYGPGVYPQIKRGRHAVEI